MGRGKVATVSVNTVSREETRMHQELAARSSSAVRIVRFPVHQVTGEMAGYELIFRGATDGAGVENENVTTSAILSAFSEFDGRDLLGRHDGFIQLTRPFLIGELPLPVAPESSVLEVPARGGLTEELLQGVSDLAGAGFRIALRNITWQDITQSDQAEPLMELADVIALDVHSAPWRDTLTTMAHCRTYDVRLMAANISSEQALSACVREGFDLISGPQISRPQTLTAKPVTPSQLSALTLLARLSDPDVTTSELDMLVRRDPALVFRLLQVANSASSGARRVVSSIRDALIMVGRNRLRSWLVLLSMGAAGGESPGLVAALTRARCCEVVAIMSEFEEPDTAFTLGLLHGVSQYLGLTPASLLEKMPSLSPEIAEALDGTPTHVRRILDTVLAYEDDDLDDSDRLLVTLDELASAYLNALAWTSQITASVDERDD
jgi:c-di-GMP-related signal transduction protein